MCLNQASSKKDKKWLINSIKNHNKDTKRVKEVIAFVKNNGGLDYAVTKMKQFQTEALAITYKRIQIVSTKIH